MLQPSSLKLVQLVQQVQQANVDDEEVACAINSKLGETPGISYSEIASKAVDCGRTHLAIKVSEHGKLSSSSQSYCVGIDNEINIPGFWCSCPKNLMSLRL